MLESRIGLVSDLKHIDLLFLANQASVAFFGEVVVAPEESLTGRVEKHACKPCIFIIEMQLQLYVNFK